MHPRTAIVGLCTLVLGAAPGAVALPPPGGDIASISDSTAPATPIVEADDPLTLEGPSPTRSEAPPLESELLPCRVFDRYDRVPFKAGLEQLDEYEERRLAEIFRPRIAGTRETRRRDLLLAEKSAKLAEFQANHIAFKGQQTGYDASILSGEFAHERGHELRSRRDGRITTHFMFAGGELWKLLLQFPAERSPFGALLERFERAYGIPERIVTKSRWVGGELLEVPVEAVWSDGILNVKLRDHTTAYKAYLAGWSVAAIDERVGPLPASQRRDVRARFGTRDVLERVTGGDDDSAADIVDRLLSGEIE